MNRLVAPPEWRAARDEAAGRAEYNYRPGGSGEMPGHSSFYRDGTGAVFHSYSTFARGDAAGGCCAT